MEIGYPRLSFTERFREWVFSPIVESGKVYFLVFFVPLSKESHLSKEVWELSLWRKNKNIFKSNNYSRVAIAGSTWISDAPTATSTPTPTSSIIGLESLRISPRTLSFTFKLKSKRGFQPISISVAGALELKRNYLAGTMWKGGRVASLFFSSSSSNSILKPSNLKARFSSFMVNFTEFDWGRAAFSQLSLSFLWWPSSRYWVLIFTVLLGYSP